MKNLRAALVTGASSGIGEAFARALAAEGLDLVLVARSGEKLRTLARDLTETYLRRVEVVTADLTSPGAAAKIFEAVQKREMPVDLLVNNAGFGSAGSFHKLDLDRERHQIRLNAEALVEMTHVFLPAMLARKRGGIINVASMAAFQPLPYMSVYAATKAFVLAFSGGLRGEVRDKGINVLCVCPGPVDTPFFEATGNTRLRATVPRPMMTTAPKVVAASLKAFRTGRAIVVPGMANRLVAAGSRLMPRETLAAMTARYMKR